MKFLGRFLFFLLLSFNLWAQTPLPVDADTIGMFNFDSDAGNTVVDDAANPATCVASSTLLEPIPGIDPSFGNARRFGVFDSFVSCGQAQGSKFDFTGEDLLTIEAVIYLENPANSYHVIFDNSQVQFMVVDNKLAGFIKQQDGFVGTISETQLNQNQTYRVTYLINQQRLTLFVDGAVVSALEFNEPIAPPAFSSLHTHIGGNVFGQYFPGYIDDVRVSSVARLDGLKPSITVNAPAIGVPIFEARPNVDISLFDDVAIDVSSIKVQLNDVLQTGLTVTASQITGIFDQDLSSTRINLLKVEVKDTIGNTTIKTFEIIYSPNTGGFEYEPDADTLALYHMNDFSRGVLLDSSTNGRHAFVSMNSENHVLPTNGVFGNGRAISSSADLTASSMTLNQQAFSFEGWFRPQADASTSSVLISTGQFKVERFLSGNIRVSIISKQTTYMYETPVSILPLNELHHLAITWNGEESDGNLRIYLDGVIALSFNAISRCDFDLRPTLVELLRNYTGSVDEVRVSSVARIAFNVPTVKEPGIHFNNLANNSSTLETNPQVNVDLNSFAGIDPSDVIVLLNNTDVTNSVGLTITATSVTGTMDAAMLPGLNTVEVRYVDADGNHAQKRTNVFHIENLGGRRNQATQDVALLVNFDEGKAKDLSASALTLTESATSYVTGVTGKAVTNPSQFGGVSSIYIPSHELFLGKRALTFEGFYRASGTPSNVFSLLQLTSNGFNIFVSANTLNGSISITGSTPVGSFSGAAASALPYDDQWHHVAFIIDDSRDYANIMLLVDGNIKYVGDFNCACDFAEAFSFNSEFSKNVLLDELVITKKAKYSFNLESQSKPIAVAMSPAAGDTVTTATPTISYVLSDTDGMNTDVTLKVNGVLQEDLTVTTTGLNVELAGNLAGLNPGANNFELSYRDLLNNEQVQIFKVYYFEKLAAQEYVSDANTLILYHMNESVGPVLMDSSNNSNDGNLAGGSFDQLGLFGTSAIQLNGGYLWQQFPSLIGLTSYTVEMWVKPESVDGLYFDVFKIGSAGLALNNGDLSLHNVHGTIVGTVTNFRSNGQNDWVHLALVVDGENVYVLADGIVIHHHIATNFSFVTTSDILSMMYSNSTSNFIEEFRLSNTARYSLISSQAK